MSEVSNHEKKMRWMAAFIAGAALVGYLLGVFFGRRVGVSETEQRFKQMAKAHGLTHIDYSDFDFSERWQLMTAEQVYGREKESREP